MTADGERDAAAGDRDVVLERLDITDFRCIREAALDPDPGINLVTGPNASGKTSLLEAIFVLGRGRPLRTARSARLARDGTDRYRLIGRVRHATRSVTIGIEGDHAGTMARIGGEPARSLANLADTLPVQIIDPDVHKLLEEGPERRRQYVDWGVFHVERRFLETWRRYQRALKQRNAALRTGSPDAMLDRWDEMLVADGEQLDKFRRRYIEALTAHMSPVSDAVVGAAVKLSYRRGWSDDRSLPDQLVEIRQRDRELGYTTTGPHRADLSIALDGRQARGRASRGQQKLIAASALIAQIRQLKTTVGLTPVLLLDDPAAELDAAGRIRLLEAASDLGTQLFVTALQTGDLPSLTPQRVFHVEHGAMID